MSFATNIRRRRKQLGMTQRQLAQAMHTEQPRISELERGETKNPTLRVLKPLAVALQTTIDALVR